MDTHPDVIVIGAGQAGLAIGYYLKELNLSFVLLDESERVGDVWRNRYDSLQLFNPRNYCGLPGYRMPGNPHECPMKDEFANYLEEYAACFSIPISLKTKVDRLEKNGNLFKIVTTKGDWKAEKVVIATGPYKTPFIPEIRKQLSANVRQLHSSEYKRPSQLKAGNVLIIGGGNSGSQIAVELSSSRNVTVSSGRRLFFLPKLIGKRSFVWWLDVLHISRISVTSRLAKYIQIPEPIVGLELKRLLKANKVKKKKRTIKLHEQKADFQDGTTMAVDNVIWATGFRQDYSWIDIDGVTDQVSQPIHHKGISPLKGLYFLGLPWLSMMSSAQINGAGSDAKRLARYISTGRASKKRR